MLLAIPVLAFLGAACAKRNDEQTIPPPETVPTVTVQFSRHSSGPTGELQLHEIGGVRCVVLLGFDGRGALACDFSRPPIYGDVGPELPAPAHCTTDTDCMERFGGDGSPRPRVRL